MVVSFNKHETTKKAYLKALTSEHGRNQPISRGGENQEGRLLSNYPHQLPNFGAFNDLFGLSFIWPTTSFPNIQDLQLHGVLINWIYNIHFIFINQI